VESHQRFIHLKHDPADTQSLSNNDVTAIYEDSSGILWVCTWAGGLTAFDRHTEDGNARFTRYHQTVEHLIEILEPKPSFFARGQRGKPG